MSKEQKESKEQLEKPEMAAWMLPVIDDSPVWNDRLYIDVRLWEEAFSSLESK